MALSSWRPTDRGSGRGVDKQPAPSVPKPAPGLQSVSHLPNSSGVTLPGAVGGANSHDDCSPDSRSYVRRGSTMDSEQMDDPLLVDGSPPSRVSSFQPFPATSRLLNLDACPSFAEQRPECTKPLFLERHGTLQLVHEKRKAAEGAGQNDTIGDGAPAPSTPSPPLHRDTLVPYLPSWDIVRSEIWLLAEAALLRTQEVLFEAATTGSASAATAAQRAGAVDDFHQLPYPPPAEPQPPAQLPHPPKGVAHPMTPFARLHVQTSLMEPQHPQPQPTELPQAQPLSPAALLRPLRHALSIARPCSSVPRGMGPLPLSLPWVPLMPCSSASSGGSARSPRHAGPSLLSISEGGEAGWERDASSFNASTPVGVDDSPASLELSGAEAAAAHAPLPGAGAAVCNDTGAGGQKKKLQSGHQQVAFAAGLAAGTSTAAALTHAATAAAAGLVTVAANVNSTSVAVQLGANALNAGTDMLMNRYQGALIKKATSEVADAVLGHAASASLRLAMRRRLRATVAGASVAWFLFNTSCMGDTLVQLGHDHDFVSSAKLVMHFASSGPGFMENCRELMQMGVAVSLGVSQRNAVGGVRRGRH